MNPAAALEPVDASLLANRWQAPPAQLDLVRTGLVQALLTDLAVIELDGPDASAFLHGQTTGDIAALAQGRWQLGGYCTPRGRLLAIFLAWRYSDGVRLLLPSSIAQSVRHRLSRFVLRAKVRIRDASADWQVRGIFGAPAAALAELGLPELGPDAWQSQALADGAQYLRLPAGQACACRCLLLAPPATADKYAAQLAALPTVAPAAWWWSQVDAALPAIVANTAERFLPQTVNLEVLGGVSFRKGCYPGQEVVARSQYLGKLRRRMSLGYAAELGPTNDLFLADQAEPIGQIVLAAAAPGGGWDLLFECPSEHLGASLHVGAAAAPAIVVRALPYALFDPTA